MATRRLTRSRTAAARVGSSPAATVLNSPDIMGLLLPSLDFRSFVALRYASKDICAATQQVCEDLISVLQRAAALYVSPQFTQGLALMAQHQPHISWLLQTPVLALVAPDRHDELIAGSYHLLQAHLTRLQKLSVSLSLRAAAARPCPPHRQGARFMLMHLGVRLGMFSESAQHLRVLLESAQQAVVGLQDHYRGQMDQPPATAAAHYTLAGFYTYHHRRPEMKDALGKAHEHLQHALLIQTRQLGKFHVSTLCSQLVKAQVMLLQANTAGCGRLLSKQIEFCERTLSGQHPLAAKMLGARAPPPRQPTRTPHRAPRRTLHAARPLPAPRSSPAPLGPARLRRRRRRCLSAPTPRARGPGPAALRCCAPLVAAVTPTLI